MGYLVGRVCYEDEPTALDVLASNIAPRITENGTVIAAEKNGKDWYVNGTVFHPKLATCDPAAPFQAGLQISAIIIGLLVSATVVGFISNVIKRAE